MKVFSWPAILLLSLFWFQASSQILVGPIAGANYSWTTFVNKDLKDSYKMIPTFGFHVGGHLAFKVRNNVEEPNRFQFGLNFVAGMVLEPAFAAANIIYDPL